uniref:Mucin 5AC, oligomeric mucus/gel-forming n=1 Tax=Theropithecus gelada TaxID=9565 RepID=A0A8D2G410_THEGE
MGVGQRKLAPLWTLALALACTRHTGTARSLAALLVLGGAVLSGPQAAQSLPWVPASNPAHNGRVCSTWGDFHYKTFDGDVFRFPGLCNYVFSEHCGAAYEDFNVQLRRSQESAAPTLSRVLMKVDGVVIQLTNGSVLVNGRPVLLPFSQSGVFIQQSSSYTKVEARLGLVLMWNHDDSLLLELDAKYANETCGLCGDFNGMPVVSELLSHNIKLTPMEFGNLQKMDDPTEQCEDPVPEPPRNCSTGSGICEELLNGQLFSSCVALVDVGSYLEACRQDLCFCGGTDLLSCVCHTLAEYSRQCAHAGGLPQDWRGPDLCPQTCPSNMQYHECRSPCTDTCSNQEHSRACEDHCVAGCFCPEGTVLDDVGQTGCVPVSQCACVYNGTAYAPGATYSTDCTNCTCSGGRWSCQEVPCPGTCSVLGGAHFSTFDERHYTVHGDCSYVLTKPCDSSAFTVLAELRRCGLTDSETCLKSVTLSLDGAQTVVVIKASGEVFLNQIYTQLPISAANVTIFRPSTFFIIAQTNLGLQLDLQLVPTMQLFVRLAPKLRGQTCGLCGNFNSIQADDFRTLSGVVEATAAAFFNTFKTQAACPNIRNSFEDPCSLSVENEKYAQHWCSQLTDASGPFSRCHAAVKPDTYYSNCMFDTCNCERSEDCLCAVLSSYVHACAAKGVQLSGWRNGVCTKPMTTCPKSMTYHYNVSTCQPTCRSLSEGDITCSVGFIPVDGCICPEGTFLDDTGKCVQASNCPCYHRGSVIPNGESVHDSGAVCTCTHGKLSCIGGQAPTPVCAAPMVFFDCHNATPGDTGAGCQKSCHTLDMTCYSPQCVPGCVCPDGLVADGEGNCITVEDCPCVHNEASYRAGQTIRVGCNTCTCDSRMWRCTDNPCLATCAVYGDGHYLTFDGQSYSFNGDCEYMLVQNHCGGKGSAQDSFRVVTENVPCGTTGTTCSKAIKIFLGGSELKLSHGKVEVTGTNESQEVPYTIRQMGIYLVVDTDIGLVLLWDKKTSIFINLSPEFKSRVCGLCGNFDDIAVNDFATRSRSVVGDVLEFGNSWKLSPSCPDALAAKDPCTANPFRKSWAQKQCSILHGPTFAACHAHVEPARYYEACVNDACACDSGGDCECFCTAVAAYAQACHEAGLCVSWRTPSICPLFCDYYNPEGKCEWHYQPCGAPCLRTCQNPRGDCLQDVRGLEGCYPKCPPEAPIFDEDKMQCVATCPTPPPPPLCHVHGKSYRPGAVVPSDKNCHSCLCTERGVECTYEAEACVCTYDGQRFHPGDVIYHTTDGTGGCISARCGANGTIERRVYPCSPTTPVPPTTFSFSTPPLGTPISTHASSPVPSSMHTGPPSSAWPTTAGTSPRTRPPTASASLPPVCGEECLWSPWMDISHPGRGVDSGDFDTLKNLRAHGYLVCESPRSVECRAEDAPRVPLRALGQRVQCSPDMGLTCRNREQASGLCYNYQIRVLCCMPLACSTSSSSTQTTPPTTSKTTETRASASSVPSSTPGPVSLSTSRATPAPGTATSVKRTFSTPSPPPVPATSTSSVSTTAPGTSVVSSKPSHTESITPSCVHELCTWTEWIDGSYPDPGINGGDFDTFQNLRDEGYKFCENPQSVECRAVGFPNTPLADLGQDVICSRTEGLICLNKNQLPPICYNYEIRIQCCKTVNKCRDGTRTLKTITTTRPTPHPAGAQTQTTFTTHVPSASTDTTSVSKTSTSHVSVSKTTHSQPVTSDCHPQCTWTKWFDVDFPSPGPHGGDEETYNNIIRSGEKICRQPEEITRLQCRATSHPEVSIEHLGQVVQCSREEGLVCRNQDQQGPFKMCLNYEVRVLCCEIPKGCPVTAVTPYGTSTNTLYPSLSTSVASTSVASSSVASSSVASSSVAYSTPTCFCNVTDRLYPMGSTIYRHRDLAGHCYYALCSQDCQVVRGVGSDCPSTTLPPAPATSPWTSTSEPVTELGCPNAVPPRKKGETWATPNCSEATCEGNNIISLRPRTCPRVEKPTCANGYPALKVADQDGCCYHYQCQCVCSGWGDPHYITFDGTYYTFLDNCTYVLVQQIVPVYGHFRVLVDNDFCGAEDGLSCPKSIILEYQQDRVVLTRKSVHGAMTNEIIFNNKVVSPGFRKNGIVVSRVGIKMYATIPALGVQVMFSGLIFSVEVPFSKFANNTEGQCGTCTNDLKDECRTPGGTVVASCSEMSGLWNVSIPNQPACHGPRPLPTTVGPTTVGSTTFRPTTPPAPCPPSSICRLILSKVFEPCHAVIPPLPFYEGCTFDQCHKTDLDTVCSSLELYAALCASQDICIDWRGRTNHMCPFTCPADKVYQPCGPSNPSYCYGNDSASLGALPEAGPITEGCFCPEGMTFFSTSAQVCVPTGWCLGPHGEPVKVGHTVSRDCQECTCEAATWTLTCRPKLCPLPPACPLPGFVPVPAAPQAGQCCPQYNCACNTSHCPAPVDCPEGAHAIPTYEEGDCCPVQKCSDVCCPGSSQPGAVVSSSLCETCRCELPGGPLSDTFVVSCETQICNSHCPVGFEYQEQSGQCCGTCVQVACVTNTSGSSTHLFYPGMHPGNHCVTYECEKHLDGLVVVTTKKACPPLSCSLDEARMSKDGCCRFCPPPPLPPQYQNRKCRIIQQQGCNSSEPVRLAYCRGNCGDSSSMYSFEGNMVEHRCQCCQELRTSLRNVTLHCADGSSRTFSFTEVEQCGCRGQRCPTPGDTQHSEEMGPEQSQEAGSGSWERGTLVSPIH